MRTSAPPPLPTSRPPSARHAAAALQPTEVLASLEIRNATLPRMSAALLAYRHCPLADMPNARFWHAFLAMGVRSSAAACTLQALQPRRCRGASGCVAHAVFLWAPDPARPLMHHTLPGAARSMWAGRIADVAADASGLRLACAALAAAAAEGGGLRLDFLNLAAQLKFSVLLRIGAPPPLSPALGHQCPCKSQARSVRLACKANTRWPDSQAPARRAGRDFPLGALACQARIRLAAPGTALAPPDIEAVVAAVAPGYGRLQGICCALARLAAAAGPRDEKTSSTGAGAERGGRGEAAAAGEGASLHLFSNPLFTQMTPGQVA